MADVFPQCKGTQCSNGMQCVLKEQCLYRSSADEAREVIQKEMEKRDLLNADMCGGKPPVHPKPDFSSVKPTNPKDLIGSDKVPFHLWPEIASAYGALGLLEGALKYGRGNFRAIGVRASIYYDAARRHLAKWFEGEEADPDSGLPHLAHALACLAILVDAEATGKLTDDRAYPGGYAEKLAELTPHVARMKAKYAERSPKHYTIKDSK